MSGFSHNRLGFAEFINGVAQVVASRRESVANPLPSGSPISGFRLADRRENLADCPHALKKEMCVICFLCFLFHAYNIPPYRYLGKPPSGSAFGGLVYEKECYAPQLDATKRQLRITQKGAAHFADKYAGGAA
jgi:hypothetical protein